MQSREEEKLRDNQARQKARSLQISEKFRKNVILKKEIKDEKIVNIGKWKGLVIGTHDRKFEQL